MPMAGVRDFVVSRYGEFVFAETAVLGNTIILWISPIVVSRPWRAHSFLSRGAEPTPAASTPAR